MKPTNLAQYYTGKGQTLPSVADRGTLFANAGLGAANEYQGTISQNNSLLAHLTSTDEVAAKAKAGTPAPDSAVTTSAPPVQPAPGNPTATVAPTTGASYRSQVEPAGGQPAAPKYMDTYAALRASQGIDTLDDNINQLMDQKAAMQDQLPAFKHTNEIGATSGAVFNARMSEEERDIADQVNLLDRQITLAQNNLSIKNDYISTMMSLTEKDYTAAKDQYETAFTKNVQIQNAVDTQADKVQTGARANITTMFNMMRSSGLSLQDFIKQNPGYATNLASLETQAGWPPGTVEYFETANPKSDVIGMGSAEHGPTDSKTGTAPMFIPVIHRDRDTGRTYTTEIYTGGVYTPTASLAGLLNTPSSDTTTTAVTPDSGTIPDTSGDAGYDNLPPPVQ